MDRNVTELLNRSTAAVEASAGTGKTFRIKEIVLECVLRGTPIDRFLIVTFTEKAAGELRDRIRKTLRAALQDARDDDARARLGAAVAAFDTAAISTIHSFCQSVLKEFAFENRMPMTTAVQNDFAAFAASAVRETLRTVFARELSGALAGDGDAVARAVRILAGKQGLERTADALAREVAAWRGADLDELEDIDCDTDLKDVTLDGLAACLREAAAAGGDADARTRAEAKAGVILRTHLFRHARAVYERTVADCGDITFDSMVLALKRALDDASIRRRVEDSLKSKYDIAVIDEFQDTDAVQWDIFRRVFTDDPAKRLIVVGDPKQAIYSFRSADLETYKLARDVLNAPWRDAEPGAAAALNLPDAWRCTRELVDVFNALFASESWFGTAAGQTPDDDPHHIPYHPVNYPAEANVRSDGDETGLPAVARIDMLCGDPRRKSGPCRATLAREAVALIQKTVGRRVGQERKDKDSPWEDRRLGYGDYCILVRGHKDARPFIQELRRRKIPYVFYKEPGLQSDSAEIETVALLLEFLGDPRGRAAMNGVLISDFFARGLAAVADGTGLEDRELGEFLNTARRFILKRRWEKLFDWLLNGTRLAANCLAAPYGARRFEAYRQIFDALLTARARPAASLADFLDTVNTWRAGADASAENETYRRRDSDAARVQIMTMHASKGLEFPVVVIGSGLSMIVNGRLGPQAFSSKRDGTVRRRSAVVFSKELTEQYNANCVAEAKRLYYVALTRAKYKIILPEKVSASSWMNKASPLATFVTPACDGVRNTELVATVPPCGVDEPAVGGTAVTAADAAPAVEVFSLAYLKNNRVRVDSFSGLNGSAAHGKADERDAGVIEEMARAALPPGAKSGTVFHEVMERLCRNTAAPDFASVGSHATEEALFADAAFMELVRRAMEANRLRDRDEGAQTTRREIARLAWNALRTELTLADGARMRLRDVPHGKRRAEIEFYAPESALLRGADARARGDDLMNGFIDLVFEWNGRFHILDWKTNFLGAYDAAAVRGEMAGAGYLNQFKIYWLSFARRLETCFGDGAAARLGGSVYLFVRGVGRGAPGDGVYTESCDLARYAREVGAFIAGAGAADGTEV